MDSMVVMTGVWLLSLDELLDESPPEEAQGAITIMPATAPATTSTTRGDANSRRRLPDPPLIGTAAAGEVIPVCFLTMCVVVHRSRFDPHNLRLVSLRGWQGRQPSRLVSLRGWQGRYPSRCYSHAHLILSATLRPSLQTSRWEFPSKKCVQSKEHVNTHEHGLNARDN